MQEFFYGQLGASNQIKITEAYAIFNPILVTSFINYRQIITSRMVESPQIFAKQDWKKSKQAEAKNAVYSRYLDKCQNAGWNEGLDVPILLTCHVTDFNIAMTIASTGFAALSSVDVGWHGAGVYFTTHAMYACQYFAQRADPALLLSFVTLGNVFPVTESHTGPTSLTGQRLKPGYTAHYVTVRADGTVPGKDDDEDTISLYDEIVVSQEPQICPVYVLRIGGPNLNKVIRHWNTGRGREGREKRKSVVLPNAIAKTPRK
eukprot:TRINITY_DN2413_c1_g1_i1.p1 TRINITY_DN2413_c1_g1~~TRINITY_DN2413_c1_g1_i1.p1  ORF type:complete len:271 (-),score=42.85 TRINITY_DN2413_c1_g1_i1:83-865(-)